MKIACLLASPRKKSNSSYIAKYICEKAKEKGAELNLFTLNDMKYVGCQACMACKTGSDKCVIQDDLEVVLDTVADADVLVMASPIYFGDVSAQLKGFIDRAFSYLVPDFYFADNKSRLKAGKKMIMVLTQGHEDLNSFADVYPKYQFFFSWYGYTQSAVIRGAGLLDEEDVIYKKDIMKEADKVYDEIFA
ncbi:MAG TPA: flavodoxin family protein [Victivallales bacterium]|nr:flavodoxin family protein [Victivallales bacterium]HPO89764.1 flavodoxin family protein [Victivallales bacterium]HRR05692.1 flavodoxin family protein [Victivallales bacterium]HRR28213.1 flavodoxin family protein [Victivallales bacterium]HRU00140.1 flavodoxin family protein [Victivallales bacterium]